MDDTGDTLRQEGPAWDEAERSDILRAYAILDTPREADFDDIARMASEICGTPIAIVNLVDSDRQFFKAEIGIGVRETPLETSFCRHAILAEDVLVIPDATADPRFECNPLVTAEPGLRFYAGVLMRTPSGLPIGTLCVLDTRPRQLDARQIDHLRILARQAMTQIELRRTLIEQGQALAAARAADARSVELTREMSHRLKNTLAVVQAIVAQVFRNSATIEESRRSITARLGALARAQDILTANSDESVGITTVVETALAPHRTGQGRIAVTGPDFLLTRLQAVGLTMAVHELATNAVKYGALSGPDGETSIAWTLSSGKRIVFEWRESGGPPVASRGPKGLGSRLLEQVVPSYFDGEASLDFSPDGVRFRLVGRCSGAEPT